MDAFGWYFLVFIGVNAAVQWYLARAMRGREGGPAPPLDDVLDVRSRNQTRLILYFWRPGCSLCGPTSMIINPLLEERRDIVKIDAFAHRDLLRRFAIPGTPALVIVNEGRIERVLVGSRNEQQIRELVGADQRSDDENVDLEI